MHTFCSGEYYFCSLLSDENIALRSARKANPFAFLVKVFGERRGALACVVWPLLCTFGLKLLYVALSVLVMQSLCCAARKKWSDNLWPLLPAAFCPLIIFVLRVVLNARPERLCTVYTEIFRTLFLGS